MRVNGSENKQGRCTIYNVVVDMRKDKGVDKRTDVMMVKTLFVSALFSALTPPCSALRIGGVTDGAHGYLCSG